MIENTSNLASQNCQTINIQASSGVHINTGNVFQGNVEDAITANTPWYRLTLFRAMAATQLVALGANSGVPVLDSLWEKVAPLVTDYANNQSAQAGSGSSGAVFFTEECGADGYHKQIVAPADISAERLNKLIEPSEACK